MRTIPFLIDALTILVPANALVFGTPEIARLPIEVILLPKLPEPAFDLPMPLNITLLNAPTVAMVTNTLESTKLLTPFTMELVIEAVPIDNLPELVGNFPV